MDNHLAASWCWLQKIDTEKQYKLLHIDRHYDLLQSQIEWWLESIQIQNVDLKKISINDLINIKYIHAEMPTQENYPLLRWDNYITIFHGLYPNTINSAIFATHKDGDTVTDIKMFEAEIYELQENLAYWINESKFKWIVNLDIDYFFSEYNQEYFQLLTDEYIITIAEEIKQSWNNIHVFTIALSPELCGGWDNAVRVAKLITDHLDISWKE